jgi:hypothetical protein
MWLAEGLELGVAVVFSKKTTYELAEYMSGFTLREIDTECGVLDMVADESHDPKVSGARRTLALKYMHALDFKKPGDAREFIGLAENLLIFALKESYFAKTFPNWRRRDGFVYENGRISSVSNVTALANVQSIATRFVAIHMLEQVKRMNDSVESDPALAICSAKELVASCCKTILKECAKPLTGKEDMNDLLKMTRVELKLVPEDIDPTKREPGAGFGVVTNFVAARSRWTAWTSG